jgi:hypothetical protein
MAFNPDAFNAGLGGILQQILASRQQTQAMQQKRLDEEVPMYNQQRAWQKENSDIDWMAEERAHARKMRQPQLDLLSAQVSGQKLSNTGQDINNDAAGVALNEKIETSPATVRTANAGALSAEHGATVAGNNVKITGNQAAVSDAALPGATTEAKAATPLKAAGILDAQITKRDNALAAITQARKIIGNPSYTKEQQEGAIREYITAHIALKGAYGTAALENYKLLGGTEDKYWGGLAVDKKHYDPLGTGTYRIPLPTDIHPDLIVDPALLRAKVSSTGKDAADIQKSVLETIRSNYNPKDFVGEMPGFTLGDMPDFKKLKSSWNKGQQVERWIQSGGFGALNERLKESGIDAQQFYRNNFGVDVSLVELANNKLSPVTKGLLKQRVNFAQPENWEKDRNAYIDGVKIASSVFNDLNTSTATKSAAKDGLLQAALGAFGQSAKTATAMVSDTGEAIKAFISTYAKTVGTNANDFMSTLNMMKIHSDPKIAQMGAMIDESMKQYRHAQGLLMKAVVQGPRAWNNNDQEAQKNLEKTFTDVMAALPSQFSGFGKAGMPLPAPSPTGGTTGGGQRPAVQGGGAQVEQVDLSGG